MTAWTDSSAIHRSRAESRGSAGDLTNAGGRGPAVGRGHRAADQGLHVDALGHRFGVDLGALVVGPGIERGRWSTRPRSNGAPPRPACACRCRGPLASRGRSARSRPPRSTGTTMMAIRKNQSTTLSETWKKLASTSVELAANMVKSRAKHGGAGGGALRAGHAAGRAGCASRCPRCMRRSIAGQSEADVEDRGPGR